jgi:hypothetical protein
MGMDRGQLIETAVRSIEERLVPGAMGFIPDGTLIPDLPERPEIPGIPDRSGFIPQTPDVPTMPRIPDAPQIPDASGLMPQTPGVPTIPRVPQAPGMPDAAQNGLNQLDRAREFHANGTPHADLRNPATERASHREVAADGFADLIESEDEPQPERMPFAKDEEHATAVLRVCRNGWNVLDTRAVGGHWFSA